MESIRDKLVTTFALLSLASARKSVYARRAELAEEIEISRLLKAIGESESVQARRILNSLRGKVDMTDEYIQTLFDVEIEKLIERLSEDLILAAKQDDTPMIQVLSQLRAVERRNKAFYLADKEEVQIEEGQDYYICQFCGYVSSGSLPACCPICGADRHGFKESCVNKTN